MMRLLPVIAVVIALAGGVVLAAPGDADPNYGGFGQTLLPLGNGDDAVVRAELTFDQKMILVGSRAVSGDADLLIVRIDPDGSVDEGFGSGGVVLTDVANDDDTAEGVTLDPFGFVVVAGSVATAGNPDAVLLRYWGSGVPDATFGTAGLVQIDVSGADDRAHAVVTRPDGTVVGVGRSDGRLLLVQVTDVGAPDPAFGSNGVATPDPTAGPDRAWAATLQPDGKLLVVGEADGDVLVARFRTSGAADASFGTGGYVIRDLGGSDMAIDVALRADGAIFVSGATTAGTGGDGFVLALDDKGGSLPGFGIDGLALTGRAGSDGFTGLGLEDDGDVVAAGWAPGASDEDALVARFTPTGALDADFGVGGVVVRDVAGGDDQGIGMAVERSGRIVVGALAGNGSDVDPAVFRLRGDAPADGAEFQVNTYTTDYQGYPEVAVDGSGRFVVVWTSFGGDGTDAYDYGIHAQRFEANGEVSGRAFQVNEHTTGYQTAPAVAADASGNFVVVWESTDSPGDDTSFTSIVGRRFDASGAPLGGDFQVNTHTPERQLMPRVAANAAGDFVVVWESDSSGGNDQSLSSVQGRFFQADGTPLTSDVQLNDVTSSFQRVPVVAVEGSDVVVAWDTDTSPGDDVSPPAVVVRRFSSAGVPVDASEVQVNEYTVGVQAYPRVAVGGDGRFLVVWHGDGPADDALSGFGVFGRRYAPDGTAAGPEFMVNDQIPGPQVLADAAFDLDDSFIVMWQGAGPDDGFGIFGRLFDPGGLPTGPSFLVNRDTEDAQQRPALGQGVAGSFVVAWETYAKADSDRSASAVAAARFSSSTAFTTTSTVPLGSTTTSTSLPPTSTSTTVPGGTTTSTTQPSATTTTTSTTVPGATTSTSTTVPGATTSTSTTVPGGTTTTSTTVPGGTTTTSTTVPGGTTTTSTTVPGGTTTTTTLPVDPGFPLLGTKLIVKVRPGNPDKTLLKAIAKDPSVTLGGGNGSADDPTSFGGAVRIAFAGAFDEEFSVLSGSWKTIKKPGKQKGYKAKRADPVKTVVVKPRKLVKVVAKGSPLALDLAEEPSAVEVVVRIGGHRHCMRFVGATKFVAGRKLVSKTAELPSACLP